MKINRNVIVVPGLSDNIALARLGRYIDFLNRRRHSQHFYLFDTRWHSPEKPGEKLSRLKQFYEDNGHPSILFAYSAGVPLALSFVNTEPGVDHAHLSCGKVTGSDKIQERYLKTAPAFQALVVMSEQAIAGGLKNIKERFTCYVPVIRNSDRVIEKVNMIVPGAEIVRLPPLNHGAAIGYSLARYLPFV